MKFRGQHRLYAFTNNQHPMLYKIKVCNGCWQEKPDKKYVHEQELKPNYWAKTVLPCKILNSRTSDVNS